MNTLAVVVFAALYTHGVYCSYYHGPAFLPVVLHNGYLADTHEVAVAKNAHFAALAKQSHRGSHYSYGGDYGYGERYGYGHGDEYSGSYGGHGDFRYHGPTAIPHVLHDGHIADTHEVAAAKAEHFAAVAKAAAHGGHGDDYSGRYASGYGADHGYSHHVATYHGPIAKPVVLHNGYLADTHEVAAAKNAHLATLSQQSHYGDHYGYGGDNHAQYHSISYGSHEDIRYHGPTAIPHVLHDGHIADTHEVAAAKAEHFAAVAKAAAHGGHGDHYSGRYASGYGADHGYSHHVAPYHGPIAKPVLLKSGYLADTHEVAAAKQHHLHLLHVGPQYGIH